MYRVGHNKYILENWRFGFIINVLYLNVLRCRNGLLQGAKYNYQTFFSLFLESAGFFILPTDDPRMILFYQFVCEIMTFSSSLKFYHNIIVSENASNAILQVFNVQYYIQIQLNFMF